VRGLVRNEGRSATLGTLAAPAVSTSLRKR
jgi:hypothetical protein